MFYKKQIEILTRRTELLNDRTDSLERKLKEKTTISMSSRNGIWSWVLESPNVLIKDVLGDLLKKLGYKIVKKTEKVTAISDVFAYVEKEPKLKKVKK